MPPCLLPSSPISPILPLVLLSLVPCVLPPFIPPCSSCALVPLSLVLFSPSCLRGHQSIMQNKPNFQNRKTTATSYATKTYAIIPLSSAPKKQTQSNPIHHGEASGRSRNKPNSTPKPGLCSTPSEVEGPNKPNLSRRSRN